MTAKLAPNMKVPKAAIDSLLGTMTKKRDELPKTERQHVQPVQAVPADKGSAEMDATVITQKSNAVKTLKQEDGKTQGRPSFKREGVEYVKTSPRLPKTLKKRVDMALVQEWFRDSEDRPVTTLDMIVELALERLLAKHS